MAKISFTKLGLKTNTDVNVITWKNDEEIIEVEVKKYLPITEKLEVISKIVNGSIDENDFYNPVRLEIYTTLERIYAYTNINFTAKMKEDIFKLYDNIVSSGFNDDFLAAIPTEEFDMISIAAERTLKNYYGYKNSAKGIMEAITTDYSNLNLDADELRQKMADPNVVPLVKDILTKLG
jgi:hypothetical protein